MLVRLSRILLGRKSTGGFVLSSDRSREVLSAKRFSDLGIGGTLVESLRENLKAIRATEIQAKSFESIFSGKDVTMCSETGSGKTLAYLIPLLERIHRQRASGSGSTTSGFDLLGRSSPPVVVLCPTSDLCNQVLQVASKIDPSNEISKQWLGGPKTESSSSSMMILMGPRIRWGAVDLVVSTPAKFVDDLVRFREDKLMPSTIVFDEADFMFHGSTNEAMIEIFKYIRRPSSSMPSVQSIFVSATMPDIGKHSLGSLLIQRFMTAEVIETKNFHTIPACIGEVEFVPELDGDWNQRCYLLTQELAKYFPGSQTVLVFVNANRNASILYRFLKEKKWPVDLFHAGGVVSNTDDGRIVVATDLAARGIDWNGGVDVVVNFQMPTDVVSWIHRAGRCGRLGRNGRVVSFYKKQEEALVDLLKEKVNSGDRLDTLFSRKRSLRRRLMERKK